MARSRHTELRRRRAAPVQTVHRSLGPTLLLAQLFGLFPVSGVLSAAPRYRRGPRVLLSLANIAGTGTMTVLGVFWSSSSITVFRATKVLFFACSVAACTLLHRLARAWPRLARDWRQAEAITSHIGYPPGTILFCRVFASLFFITAVVEHTFAVTDAVVRITDEDTWTGVFRRFYYRWFPQVVMVVPYTSVPSVPVEHTFAVTDAVVRITDEDTWTGVFRRFYYRWFPQVVMVVPYTSVPSVPVEHTFAVTDAVVRITDEDTWTGVFRRFYYRWFPQVVMVVPYTSVPSVPVEHTFAVTDAVVRITDEDTWTGVFRRFYYRWFPQVVMVVPYTSVPSVPVEHTFAVTDAVVRITDEDTWTGVFRRFYYRWFPQVVMVVPYTPLLGPPVVMLNIIATFTFSYLDLLIIVITFCLHGMFKQFNKHVVKICIQEFPRPVWKDLYQDYQVLRDLVAKVDRYISPMVLVSFIINIYHICLQLYHSLRPLPTTASKIYFALSFGFLILRTAGVCVSAANIHVEAAACKHILFSVPPQEFCAEVERFIFQVCNDRVAISGYKFFIITRRTLLTVMGLAITYEVVMFQVHTVAEEEDNSKSQ